VLVEFNSRFGAATEKPSMYSIKFRKFFLSAAVVPSLVLGVGYGALVGWINNGFHDLFYGVQSFLAGVITFLLIGIVLFSISVGPILSIYRKKK